MKAKQKALHSPSNVHRATAYLFRNSKDDQLCFHPLVVYRNFLRKWFTAAEFFSTKQQCMFFIE
ncbi:hypothetical protein T03_11994 [Trichinella britovi]|uniref:Uncharacterized protein n=1 Tax=Trichinella britovi TaxID=45882 RepID=A0A0V1D6A5_TRIBR|nr:hypothetical protein T03_11994 [Trichinella britovi]